MPSLAFGGRSFLPRVRMCSPHTAGAHHALGQSGCVVLPVSHPAGLGGLCLWSLGGKEHSPPKFRLGTTPCSTECTQMHPNASRCSKSWLDGQGRSCHAAIRLGCPKSSAGDIGVPHPSPLPRRASCLPFLIFPISRLLRKICPLPAEPAQSLSPPSSLPNLSYVVR